MARARDDHALGLHSDGDFEVVAGADAGHTAGRQAAWYFANETVAIPRAVQDAAGFTPGLRAFNDVRRWNDAHAVQVPRTLPPLVWIAARDVLRNARLAADTTTITTAAGTQPLRLVPRLALNRSWFDASSAAFFASQSAFVRGTCDAEGVQARALWPEAFRFGPHAPPLRALPAAGTPGEALRALVREAPDAAAPFEAVTLWQRAAHADLRGKAVIAFILNGAQGDDDEAHAGHFAVATGRIEDDGAVAGWLVNSFYALDIESEKGIIAAPVPLANYQADLNAGQSWYRPSWVLVAVLDNDRAAQRVQGALGRVYRQFWRHQLPYYHPTDNCTSLALDTLRTIGLDVPLLGPTSLAGAWLALPALIARERSLAKARIAFDYLVTERTRLLPALALEAVFEALMRIAPARPGAGALEREISQDLISIGWMRLPQFPSSRAWGAPPVVSLAEYRARLPKDRSKMQVVPVPPRPLPEALRDPDLLPALPHPSDLALRLWAVAPLAALAAALVLLRR